MAGPLRTAIKRRIGYHAQSLAHKIDPYLNQKAVTLRNEPWPSAIYGDGLLAGSTLTDPVEQDHWLAACIRARADWIAPVEYIIMRDKVAVGPKDPIQRLFMKPNTMMIRSQLIEAIMTWQHVDQTGSCFLLCDWGQGPGVPGPGPPVMLWPFPGQQFQAVKQGGQVTGWRFTHPGLHTQRIIPNEALIRFWRFNPRAPLFDTGQNLLSPAARALSVSHAARVYEDEYIRNYGMPYAAMETKENYGPKYADEQREEWKKHHGRGTYGRNVENIAVLQGGATLKQYGATIKDLRPDSLHEASREAALAIMGVPPAIVGVLRHANWSNMKEQIVIMLKGVMRADFIRMKERFEVDFFPRFAPDKWGKFDMSAFPELEMSLKEKTEIASVWFKDMGIPLREIERILDLGFDVDKLGAHADMIYLNMQLLPTDVMKKIVGILQTKGLAAIAEPEREKIALRSLPAVIYDAEALEVEDRPAKTVTKKRGVAARDGNRIQKYRRRLRKIENEAADKVHTWFYRQRQKILAAIDEQGEDIAAQIPKSVRETYLQRKRIEEKAAIHGAVTAPAHKDLDPAFEDLIRQLMPSNMVEEAEDMAKLVVEFSEKGIDMAGEAHVAELAAIGVEIPEYTHEAVKAGEYLADRREILKARAIEHFDRVLGEISKGFLDGQSAAGVADRIRAVSNADQARSMLIARTEVKGAFNNGRTQAMKESGVQYKAWAHGYGVKEPRPTHEAANGEVVPIDEPFQIPGESVRPGSIMAPHDWNAAGAEEWCNCTCDIYTPTYDPKTGREFTPDELFGSPENIPGEYEIEV